MLTMDDNHPLLQYCPNTFPTTPYTEKDDPSPHKFTPWHRLQQEKPKYQTRLDSTIASINEIIHPASKIETVEHDQYPPWYKNRIDIQILPGTKEEATARHLERHYFTHL